MVSAAIRHARASAASLSRSGVKIYSSRSIQAARGTAAQRKAAAAGRAATSASGAAAIKQRLRDAATLKAAKLKEEARVRVEQAKALAEKAAAFLLQQREEAAVKKEEEAAEEKAAAECPKGLYYDAKWYLQCASGYVEYSLKGHNKCVCVMKIAEAKAQLDALYAKDDLAGNGEGIGFFDGFLDGGEEKGKTSGIIILVVVAVVVVALIGLLKK